MDPGKRTLTAIVLLIASSLIFSPLCSQNKKIDSLRSVFSSVHDKQIKELIKEANQMVLKEQKKFIENAFHSWKGNLEQLDDATLIVLICK